MRPLHDSLGPIPPEKAVIFWRPARLPDDPGEIIVGMEGERHIEAARADTIRFECCMGAGFCSNWMQRGGETPEIIFRWVVQDRIPREVALRAFSRIVGFCPPSSGRKPKGSPTDKPRRIHEYKLYGQYLLGPFSPNPRDYPLYKPYAFTVRAGSAKEARQFALDWKWADEGDVASVGIVRIWDGLHKAHRDREYRWCKRRGDWRPPSELPKNRRVLDHWWKPPAGSPVQARLVTARELLAMDLPD